MRLMAIILSKFSINVRCFPFKSGKLAARKNRQVHVNLSYEVDAGAHSKQLPY